MFNISIFSFLLFTFINICGQGFVAGTLVKTPHGYKPIEQIKPGDQVLSYNYRNAAVPCLVQAICSYEVDEYIEVITPNNFIRMGLTQRLFLPMQRKWIQAEKLSLDTCLLLGLQNASFIVDNVIIQESVTLYDLSVTPYHNFYVSTDDICVHNITFGIGEAAIYLGLSNPATFTPTVAILGGISIIAAGAALANKVIYDNRRAKQREIESSVEYRFNDPYRPNFYIDGKPAHYSIDKIVDSFRNPYIAQFNPGYETPEAIGKAVYDNVLAGSKDEKFARKMQQEAIAAAKQVMHQMSSSAHTSPTQSSTNIVQSKQNQKTSSVGKTIDNAQALTGKAANEVKPSNASRATSFSKSLDAKQNAFIPASKDANPVIVSKASISAGMPLTQATKRNNVVSTAIPANKPPHPQAINYTHPCADLQKNLDAIAQKHGGLDKYIEQLNRDNQLALDAPKRPNPLLTCLSAIPKFAGSRAYRALQKISKIEEKLGLPPTSIPVMATQLSLAIIKEVPWRDLARSASNALSSRRKGAAQSTLNTANKSQGQAVAHATVQNTASATRNVQGNDTGAIAAERKKDEKKPKAEIVPKKDGSGGNGGMPDKEPEDPENSPLASNPNCLHGNYKDAPYHAKDKTIVARGKGIKNKAPQNGQKALDSSVKVPGDTKRRIGISEKEFVVLDETRPNEFHGHVRTFAQLEDEMRAALEEAGLIKWNGKQNWKLLVNL